MDKSAKPLSTDRALFTGPEGDLSKAVFHSAKIPMLIILPSSGKIVSANSAACQFYGYNLKQFSQLTIHQINQLSPSDIETEMSKAVSEKRAHFDFIHMLADGSLKNVEVHSGPMTLNGEQYLYSIIHDITERRITQQQLASLNRDFITLLENTTDFVYFKDMESRFLFCSQTLANITGHKNWKDMIGKHDAEVFPPDTAKIYIEEEKPIFTQGVSIQNQVNPYYNEQGLPGWVSTNKWPVFEEDGKTVVGLFGISRDVTLQHNAEKDLKIAASVFQHVGEGVLITDANNLIIDANQAFCRLSGYPRHEIIDRSPRFLNSGHHDRSFFNQIEESLTENGMWKGDIWNRRKNGSLFACRTLFNVITNEQGETEYKIGLFSDVTQFLQHFNEVEHLAYHDALTDLANRVLFGDRLKQALVEAKRYDLNLAVCFIDLDNFKPVNDRFGHRIGDLLLKEIADRLTKTVRGADTVARLGGDEFALILSHIGTREDTLQTVQRALQRISMPFVLPLGNVITVSASIGVCFHDKNSQETPTLLLRQADRAMYEAKAKGRNCYHIYSEPDS